MFTPARVARWAVVAVLCWSCGVASKFGFDQQPVTPTVPPVITRPVVIGRPPINLLKGGRIEGILALALGAGSENFTAFVLPAGAIELPEITVYLAAIGSNAPLAKDVTQLDGKFHLQAPRAGTYRVCWGAPNVGAGCSGGITVGTGGLFIDVVPVRAARGIVYGKVLTGDGRPCWVHDSFFQLNVTTRVSLIDPSSNTPVQPDVAANIAGEYAFGGVKAGRYIVRARCEKAEAQTLVSVDGNIVSANLTLPNRAPRIDAMAAFSGGRGLTRAPAGAVVRVDTALRDADGDAIEYLWRTADNSSVPRVNTATQDWTLGTDAGQYAVYLMARDGRGGYAFKRFDMQTGAKDVAFSGRVIDETTKTAIPNASIDVNGVGTTSDNQGWFRLRVAPAPTPERYVLNIHHPQYALLSRIHDKESVGMTYELIRAQTTTHNPNIGIDIVDTSSGGPCGNPNRQTTPAGVAPPKNDPCEKPCRHRGAHLVIPAGALVDASGNGASNPVTAEVTTLNPARRSLPGDYRAVDRTSQPVEMLSFGAVHAEFRDAGGRPLNLKAGSSAEVRIPVADDQRATAPPSIAFWSYDEKSGLWKEEGQALLQNTAEGWMYIGTTTHFSTLNMDVAGSDPAQATCVRFELGASLTSWSNLVMRAYVSYGGTNVQVKETAIDSAQYHAIFRIPYAPPAPPPNTLRLEIRGTYLGQQVVLLNNIMATDAPRPKMTGTNLWPDYPYTECGAALTLEADPVNLPQYGDIDATGRPAFLTGPYGTFNPVTGEQDATDYYNTVDPGGASFPNLETWWTAHGFTNTGGNGDASAQYLNFNDLGFGRDMNCKKTSNDLACYVTNYGLPDQNLNNADAAFNHDATKRGATVAMEYKSSEPAANRVRFYVYAPGPAGAAGKLKFADLDGLGPKPVPHLCVVCHGGQYDSGSHNVLEARFREFDLPSFKYSGSRSWDFAPAPDTLSVAEHLAFGKLNQMVRDIAPNSSPIKPLINAWYPGNNFNGPPIKPAVPAGWVGFESGYHNVYAKSCRTCHVARDGGGPIDGYYTFSKKTDFATTSGVVCGFPKVMPNAFVTYKNFWSDTQRIIEYKQLTGAAVCQ